MNPFKPIAFTSILALGSVLAQANAAEPEPGAAVFAIKGSDSMLQLNLSLAQAYEKKTTHRITVDGEGSSTGIKGLIEGTAKIAATSRPIKQNEIKAIKAKHMEAPKEHVVAYDSIAICVHPSNPLDSLTLEQLKAIYGQEGKAKLWSDLSDTADAGEIQAVGRTNNSSTYAAFQKAIGMRFKEGIAAVAGSSAVVEFVSASEAAIGYVAPVYLTDGVKSLGLSVKAGEKPVTATGENIRSGSYPITRKLYFYTVGEPRDEVKEFIEWLGSKESKTIITALGFTAP